MPAAIELMAALRYTGSRPHGDGRLCQGARARDPARGPSKRQNSKSIRELPMSSTFDTIANIIAETCDIPRDSITPDSHAINDLVNDGKATTDQYFVLKNLSARIDELVAAKGA